MQVSLCPNFTKNMSSDPEGVIAICQQNFMDHGCLANVFYVVVNLEITCQCIQVKFCTENTKNIVAPK
jgi:hypothetical protein